MKAKVTGSMIMFTVASVICLGVYYLFTSDRQRVLNEVEANRSYIQTLETEVETLREKLKEMQE